MVLSSIVRQCGGQDFAPFVSCEFAFALPIYGEDSSRRIVLTDHVSIVRKTGVSIFDGGMLMATGTTDLSSRDVIHHWFTSFLVGA
jgi:hypothetical protein